MRFRTKTILGVAAIEMVLLAVLVGSVLSILRESNQSELVRRVQLGGELLAAAAKDAVISQDLATLDSLADEAMRTSQLDRIRILDSSGMVLTQRGEPASLGRPFQSESDGDQGGDGYFDWSTPVTAGGIKHGEVQLSVSLAPLQVLLLSAERWAAGIAVLEMMLVAIFSWLLGSYLLRQLGELRAATQHFGDGDFMHRVPVKGNDELALTAIAFNRMAGLIGESHQKLRHENRIRLEAQEWAELSRKQAEDRNAQLDLVLALSPDGIVSFDAGRRVKYSSAAFTRLTGLSQEMTFGLDEEAFSRLLVDACDPLRPFPGMAELRRARDASAAGHRVSMEVSHPRKRILEVSLHESNALTVSQILYFRDITHEFEVDRMKSEFLASAAHELRTPMSSIFGYTELLLNREIGPDDRIAFLKVIYSQSRQMIHIIDELLDLARIEARRDMDFEVRPWIVGDLLVEAVASFVPPDGRQPVRLSGIEEKIAIRADRGKISQVLGNVLSNAYKYSPAGGEVTVAQVMGEDVLGGNQAVGIRVTDQGIGMTEAQLSHIFDRFYRADASGAIPGTGLGMSIVKEIVDLHHGRVDVESRLGQGTVMTIWLPVYNQSSDFTVH